MKVALLQIGCLKPHQCALRASLGHDSFYKGSIISWKYLIFQSMMILANLCGIFLHGIPKHMRLLIDIICSSYTLEGHDWHHLCLIILNLLHWHQILNWLEWFNLITDYSRIGVSINSAARDFAVFDHVFVHFEELAEILF